MSGGVVPVGVLKLVLFSMMFLCCFGSPPRRPKRRPRGPQERLKRLPEAAKSTPGGPKRCPRHPRSRSRGLKTLQDRPKRLEKNIIPKTIVHINVADIAEIDKDKTLQPPGAKKKGRAGGGVPPWGRQSAARPGGARARRARHLDAIAEVAKGAKILAIDLCILLQIFFGGGLFPPL